MMNLPKDLHGLIFSFLWRIEASLLMCFQSCTAVEGQFAFL